MSLFLELFFAFLLLYSIFQLASLAGLFSEKSGVANIAIEGNMVIGATLFSIFWKVSPDAISNIPELQMFVVMILTIICSVVYMSLLSFFTNRYMADHIIIGTGMNLLAPALGILLWLTSYGSSEVIYMAGSFNHWMYHYSASIALNKLGIWMAVISLILAFITAFVLNKTTFGLRLRSSGENPYSLETAGVSVAKTRRNAVLIAGALSGMAGATFVMLNPTFNFTVTGYGFIGIAILIMAGHKTAGTTIYSIIFAIFITIFNNWLKVVPTSPISGDLMMAVPFLIPIIGLLIFRKRTVPSAVGTNFKKDQR